MSEYDVADVVAGEAQALDLAQRGLGGVAHRLREQEELASERALWPLDVAGAEPRIHQHEPLGGLDQQAMADELGRREERAESR